MSPAKHVALVTGATGVVGARLAQELALSGDWRVIGSARAVPAAGDRIAGVDYVAVDLTDAKACHQLAAGLKDASELVALLSPQI